MKLSQDREAHHSGIRQFETPQIGTYVLVKPYILHDFVYLHEGSRKVDLELPSGTEVTIQWHREFPGKVWLVAKIPIQTPQGIIIEPLARLVPETDLEYFEVSHLSD
jgi:hypothetical protein